MTLLLIQRLGWKRALLLFVLIVAAFAWWVVPHLVHKETTLQISATQSGLATPDGFLSIRNSMSTASALKASRQMETACWFI